MAGWFIAFVLGAFVFGMTVLSLGFMFWGYIGRAMDKIPAGERRKLGWVDGGLQRRDQWRVLYFGLPEHAAITDDDLKVVTRLRMMHGGIIAVQSAVLFVVFWPLVCVSLLFVIVTRLSVSPWQVTP